MMSVAPKTSTNFEERLGDGHLAPLWTRMADLITPAPRSSADPHRWRYADVRDVLLEAGEVISAAEAERRVLILENPGLPGSSRITTSLYCGLQLVLPGEVAPAHRHSQSAMRFILEGSGAYSVVDGEPTFMEVGDVVLTPPMSWHDHGNTSEQPMIWLDALDIPMVGFFDASFLEKSTTEARESVRPAGDSLVRYGFNLRPVETPRRRGASPIVSYPWTRTREALRAVAAADDPHPCHGHKLTFVNPVDGGDVLSTISGFAQLLPAAFTTRPYRSTDATVFVPIEGHGRTTVDGVTFEWGPKDVFVVPSWRSVVHEAVEESMLLSYSDRSAQQKLGLWREDSSAASI